MLPSRAFPFRACVRASLLLFLCGSARLSAGAAKPLYTPPNFTPRRKDAATETKAHASTLAPSALCLVAKRALFPRPSRQAVAVPYGHALPIGAAVLGQTLAIGSAAVAPSPFFFSPRGSYLPLQGFWRRLVSSCRFGSPAPL